MTNGLFSLFSSLIANTPPYRKGLSSRKFLSLFLILFLAVGNAWGQEITHTNPATITVANRVFLDLQGTPSNVTVGTDNYSNYGPGYFIQNKTTLSWWSFSGTFKSSSSSYSNASNAVGFQSPGSSSASEFYQKLQMREGSDRMTQMDFYVKGTTSVGFQWKNGGTSNKYLTFTIYEMNVTGTTATDESTPVAIVTGNTASSSVQYAATEILDGSKYYHVQVTPKGTSNIDFYGLTFKHVPAAPATEYSVTYDLNGGTGTEPTQGKVAENGTFTVASAEGVTPPAGQEFAGWSDGTNIYNAGDTYTMGSADVILTAQWQAETPKYDVTYSLNGGTGTEPTQGKVAENGTFTVASAEGITPPAGKEFAGWSDGTNTYNAGDTYTMGAAAVTFTAQWKAAPTVIFDWTAANSSNIEADNTDLSNATYGTLTVGTSVAGRLLGTNTIAKSSSGYKLGNNDVCIEIQGTSAFEEGDIVVIIGKNGGDGERSFAIAPESATAADAETVINTSVIGAQTDNSEYKVVITATQAGTKMRVFRLAGKSMYVKSIKVIRPAQKEILSTDITLSAVTVNTEAISAENLATLKADPYKLDLTSEYAEAPTIAFTKQTVITYEDATTKTKTETIEVAAIEVDGKWQAQTEINAITYTVTALIPATYTVIYKDGGTELASESVKVGEHPTAEGVESKPLYTLSWKLDEEVVELSNVTGNADQEIILTAVWTPKYATSLDFAAITTAGTTEDNPIVDFLASGNMVASNLGGSEWETSTSKSGYVGYKLKNSGATITFLAQEDKRVTITFGSIAADVTLKKGDETVTISANSGDGAETVYNLDVTTDMVVAITTSSGSTVTLKSITIGEIPTISDDATLKDLKVNGETIDGFSRTTKVYYLTVPYGTEVANMPKITEATPNHASAAAVIYPEEGPKWEEEYGCYLQQVVVTAENGTKGYYHVRTTVDAKQGVTIIKATHTGEATADVTGYIGGSVDKNTQGGGKLGGTDQYFGVKLAEGTFLEGDVVTIYASTVSTKVQIFSDKGETMINEGVFNGNYYTYTLTDATEWIYLYRTETAGSAMNPTLGYFEVQRYMAPFIETFEVAGAQGVVDEEHKTITVEVPASTDVTALTPTIVAWANGGATVTPTGPQDFTSPVVYSVASAYAEDGTTEYTVTVTKAAAIKEVNITGGTDIKEDEKITLSATVIDTNDAEASNQNVTWTSNDETTAIVDANGVVTGVKAGTVKITATSVADNTKSASVTITVTENPCRIWNAPAESFSGDITKGKLSIKNSGCSIGDVTPFSGASKVYAYKIDGSSDYVELSFTDKSQFETLTLGVSSGSNGSTPTFVVVASKSAVFDEKTIVEIFTYNANAKDAEQSLVDVSIPEGTRNVRIYRKYNDIGDGSSVSVYYVNACKKDFVPLTTVSVNNAKLGKGKSLNLKAIITPANADIESLAWSIESMTATNVTILGNVLTAAENATEGDVVVKVVATDVLSNVVGATATISIVDKFEVVKPVTATQVWNWAPVAVGEGETIADPDTVLANYISGDEWEMLAGNVGGRPYRSTSYKAYQGTSLYFKAAVPGLLIMYAGSTGNDKDVFVNGTKVGAVKSNKAYMDTIAVQAGDVYITSESMRIYWMKFDTDFASYEITDNHFNGYTRDVRQGYYGTICLPNGGVMVGASIFEIAYKDASKIYFDKILSNEMVAGVPYIFLPNEGADKLAVFYTDEANASAGSKNGLVGSYTQELLAVDGNNYILLNNQYCEVIGEAYVGANRAYFQLSGIPTSAPAPAPGVHRVSMGMAGQNTATGVDQVQDDEVPTKMIINGQLFILRGEKMYDAQGKLVK